MADQRVRQGDETDIVEEEQLAAFFNTLLYDDDVGKDSGILDCLLSESEDNIQDLINFGGVDVDDKITGMIPVEGLAPRRIRLQAKLADGYLQNQESEQETNRLDYFSFTDFNLHGDDNNLTIFADYGGGGQVTEIMSFDNGISGHEAVVDRGLEQERASAGGGEVVVEKLEPETGSGGEGDDLVVIGWWEKWLLLFNLWKMD